MKLHHIGYAVEDIDSAVKSFSQLGFTVDGLSTVDSKRDVKILFMRDANRELIELVEPLDDNAPITETLKHNKEVSHPYHLCFEVDDIPDAISSLRKKGFVLISDISPAPAIASRDVCFLMNKHTGLIELIGA